MLEFSKWKQFKKELNLFHVVSCKRERENCCSLKSLKHIICFSYTFKRKYALLNIDDVTAQVQCLLAPYHSHLRHRTPYFEAPYFLWLRLTITRCKVVLIQVSHHNENTYDQYQDDEDRVDVNVR
jgi:hypothetical protein